MNLIQISAVSLNQTPLDWEGNVTRIISSLRDARQGGAELVCLPELAISGYGCEDAFLSEALVHNSISALEQILPATEGLIVALGLPVFLRGSIYNCVALVSDKQIVGIAAKRLLANEGVHYEPRWFRPWPIGKRTEILINGRSCPFGDLIFKFPNFSLGFEICEEAWGAERPGQSLAVSGVEIILNPSASHFSFGKYKTREQLVLEGSRAFSCIYVYTNLNGNEAGRLIYDGGALIASCGKMLARGDRLFYSDYSITNSTVDLDDVHRKQMKGLAHRREIEQSERYVVVDGMARLAHGQETSHDHSHDHLHNHLHNHLHSGNQVTPCSTRLNTTPVTNQSPPLNTELCKEEEFARVAALGLHDYLRKSGTSGFVLSLSGGADSGSIALLVYYMVYFGIHELGMAEFCRRLKVVPPLDSKLTGAHLKSKMQGGRNNVLQDVIHNASTNASNNASNRKSTSESSEQPHSDNDIRPLARHIVSKILLCIYQATENNSQATWASARTIAETVGAEFQQWNINPLVSAYCSMAETVIGRPLTWQQDDIAMQNIQARVRAPGVWLLANIRNALLLATSNRSEAAVGYATMDGDTSGSLAPLGGINKSFLLEWLNWAAISGPAIVGATPELQCLTDLAPTAELKPLASYQTDESDLMPYDILNSIELALIRDRMSKPDCLYTLQSTYPDVSFEVLESHIDKFSHLWARNQWKRERLAPCFYFEDNLDPKTCCRFPILSSGLIM